MVKRTQTSKAAVKAPPQFPALTKAQRDWVAARREELKAAIDAGIESGRKDGYRAFDIERILCLIEERRQTRRNKRAKRA